MENRIDTLHKAAVELGDHVAAMVRTTNAVGDLLADLGVDGLSATTKALVVARVKELHEQFRAEHFRGSIDSVNTVFGIVDELYREEPEHPAEAPQPAPEKPADAPVA